jgi:hypothetical protein
VVLCVVVLCVEVLCVVVLCVVVLCVVVLCVEVWWGESSATPPTQCLTKGCKTPKLIKPTHLIHMRGVSKTFGEWHQKTKNRRYKQINFIGLQYNRHPSQHTVGNVHKASGNCQQMPLYESIAEPLSHVLGLPPRL